MATVVMFVHTSWCEGPLSSHGRKEVPKRLLPASCIYSAAQITFTAAPCGPVGPCETHRAFAWNLGRRILPQGWLGVQRAELPWALLGAARVVLNKIPAPQGGHSLAFLAGNRQDSCPSLGNFGLIVRMKDTPLLGSECLCPLKCLKVSGRLKAPS